MSDFSKFEDWTATIESRYYNYLTTSFCFNKVELRKSFENALRNSDLIKGPFPEPARNFVPGINELELARHCFPDECEGLTPALHDRNLWMHQERAIRTAFVDELNVVVASGTASGKTESFIYPIMFSLYQQHLNGDLNQEGVRALVLYPMNALANDQRRRLGEICDALQKANSDFFPTFGQYTGQTPQNLKDKYRNAYKRENERLPGELIYREEMTDTPPHILLTNYSMLEYLLIRPADSPLFDNGRGRFWQFLVLDEAHQYRGTKGMEVGMLMRRLKQRISEGGRKDKFRCIATSATISSSTDDKSKIAVASFAEELFGEPFKSEGVVYGKTVPVLPDTSNNEISRHHVFLRALEGAFLLHKNGEDLIVLNRTSASENGSSKSVPIEVALCRECGQHYYVGKVRNNKLVEGVRDPSQEDFGVEYFIPVDSNTFPISHYLCRSCAKISKSKLDCDCDAVIPVHKCANHSDRADQIKECKSCGYKRGSIGDPVQEIIHGSDGPNSVIATALHELLPEGRQRVLAFADSRQEAAFFAWYAEDSYEKIRNRNYFLRALREYEIDSDGLSIGDLRNRLLKLWTKHQLFTETQTTEDKNREVLKSILFEALTDDKRLSLAGVGLVEWFIDIPNDLKMPIDCRNDPWNFDDHECQVLMKILLDQWRIQRALSLPDEGYVPNWNDILPNRPQFSFSRGAPSGQRYVREWGSSKSTIACHLLGRILEDKIPSRQMRIEAAVDLLKSFWDAMRDRDRGVVSDIDHLLIRSNNRGGNFRLNHKWLRLNLANPNNLWTCDTCLTVTTQNLRNVCPRNICPGVLVKGDIEKLKRNHYRILYENQNLPPSLRAEEHTAQLTHDEAADRQNEFKSGQINLLSSSTTFEMGVDLGELDVAFLRNVPPESFNYVQRVGRAGRRDTPGFAITYCRRNPHDLYHYENPRERIIQGEIRPPKLQLVNSKIISRHVCATALAWYFRTLNNEQRFQSVHDLIGNWDNPTIVDDIRSFCTDNHELFQSLTNIVPKKMHDKCGISDNSWIDEYFGDESRLALAVLQISSEYRDLDAFRRDCFDNNREHDAMRIRKRMNTISDENCLSFLSRKAVIPKYGFPVDVVELDTNPESAKSGEVSLQRALSQAISEYAPGGKVVANKKEFTSFGLKMIPRRQLPIREYAYDADRNFEHWNEKDFNHKRKKYIEPNFGFVTSFLDKSKPPRDRTKRLYSTRPFFTGFDQKSDPVEEQLFGVTVTHATPGSLVILCEGKGGRGFYICHTCGTHTSERVNSHKTYQGKECKGTLRKYSLAHELVTDVARLRFPHLTDPHEADSVGYAILLGTAEFLDISSMELGMTVTGIKGSDEKAIVIYDNVPGGAGLVAELSHELAFRSILERAKDRVVGRCGCDSSCYGCLRSYRNQFAHSYLDRKKALSMLKTAQ